MILSQSSRIFRCPLKTQVTSIPLRPPPSMRKSSLLLQSNLLWLLSNQRSLVSILKKKQLNKFQSMRGLSKRKATRRSRTLTSDTQ
jgi:hypothetical protein